MFTANNAYPLAGTFVFQFHGLCGLPYVAVAWQVTARHHLL